MNSTHINCPEQTNRNRRQMSDGQGLGEGKMKADSLTRTGFPSGMIKPSETR